jgi:hypothetical protein
MLEVHPLRSSLVVVVLQNSLHHISVDPKINLLLLLLLLLLSLRLEVPTPPIPPTPPTGEHDLVPPLVNLSPVFPETSNRLISCKMLLRGLFKVFI